MPCNLDVSPLWSGGRENSTGRISKQTPKTPCDNRCR